MQKSNRYIHRSEGERESFQLEGKLGCHLFQLLAQNQFSKLCSDQTDHRFVEDYLKKNSKNRLHDLSHQPAAAVLFHEDNQIRLITDLLRIILKIVLTV